ncbi:hypothetical protein [Christiangramia portivictoriae]|uniref:hypothetical protein n=1 Tax=Christiangramia portivictoriae TaxID=326069 RepID=UPI00040958FC|nr:hypothetical protein [Christiangramia portivictoriae]
MKTKNVLIILAIVGAILLIPFIGSQVSTELNWSSSDFVIMGTLLFLTGLAINFALSRLKTFRSRLIACAVIIFVLLIVWAELAVGIFGTPFAGS